MTSSRNGRCPCGSGKKYKKCCLAPVPNTVLRRKEDHYPSKFQEARKQVMQENGQNLPGIQVLWDEKTQNVALRFDPKEFLSWPFLIAVLEMAAKEGEKQWRLLQMMQLGQQAQEQQQAQAIAQKLQLGKG